MAAPGVKKSFNFKFNVLAAALMAWTASGGRQETTDPQLEPQTHRPRPEVKTRTISAERQEISFDHRTRHTRSRGWSSHRAPEMDASVSASFSSASWPRG